MAARCGCVPCRARWTSGSTAAGSWRARGGAGALILGGVPVGAGAQRTRRPPFVRTGRFTQGVASGEPSTRAMTLWTRLEGLRADRRLTLEVARDDDFRRVVYRRNVIAQRVRGRRGQGARHARPEARRALLLPLRDARTRARRRHVRDAAPGRLGASRCGSASSPARTTRRATSAPTHAIAREDVDLVVCLGDYIYEKQLLRGAAQGHARRERRRRGPDARRVPRQVRAVPQRPRPAGDARGAPVPGASGTTTRSRTTTRATARRRGRATGAASRSSTRKRTAYRAYFE